MRRGAAAGGVSASAIEAAARARRPQAALPAPPPHPPATPPPARNERRAFLDPYAQFSRFSDGNGALLLDEFLDAKETVAALSAEYEACERPDYIQAAGA